jgi:hypothetical protein
MSLNKFLLIARFDRRTAEVSVDKAVQDFNSLIFELVQFERAYADGTPIASERFLRFYPLVNELMGHPTGEDQIRQTICIVGNICRYVDGDLTVRDVRQLVDEELLVEVMDAPIPGYIDVRYSARVSEAADWSRLADFLTARGAVSTVWGGDEAQEHGLKLPGFHQVEFSAQEVRLLTSALSKVRMTLNTEDAVVMTLLQKRLDALQA